MADATVSNGGIGRNVSEAVEPLLGAFWNYEETVHLLARTWSRRYVLPRFLAADVAEAARVGRLYLAHGPDGHAVGAAAWSPPGTYPEPWHRQLLMGLRLIPGLPLVLPQAAEALRGRRANAGRHRLVPPHYWLRVIGVDQTWRGRGVGTALMRPVLEVADAESAPCFLFTAHEANVSWYERHGFGITESFRPTPRWPTVWSMLREPKAPAPDTTP